MPHLKCTACGIRLHSRGSTAGGVGELCPACGSLLEPVVKLSELVGLQVFHRDPDESEPEADAGRWLDDGGSFFPEAVAQALARPDRPE